jgi:uncharacterized membrane protein YqjE
MSLPGAARRFVHRALSIGENRFQLFVVELQEERDRLLNTVLLAVAIAAVGLLCGITWSAALVIIFWHFGPIPILLILGAVYGLLALVLWRRLVTLRRHQPTLAATLDQLRKDRACLEKS